MIIDINQHKIAVGDKYKIYVDNIEKYYASKHFFELMPIINLFECDNARQRMIISKRMSWFKAKYEIQTSDNNLIEFKTKSIWKLHYQCQCGSDSYDIYGHIGRKYSVYKNELQVASWDKEAVSWFEGDNYRIIADVDCDIDLIISFCLIVDNFSNNDNDGNTVTYDFGNIGFQAKKFNNNWQPKK